MIKSTSKTTPKTSAARAAKHLVVALAYDQLCTFEFGCTVEVFALDRPELEVNWYEFAVCAVARGPIRARGGITVTAPYAPDLLDHADTIIVPGWSSIDAPVPPSIIKKLRAAYARGARLCSLCSGVFVLAAAGLLDGKAATTHWRYAKKLKERFPLIDVQANALYVDTGQVITAAGSAAGLGMLLHIVRTDFGAKVGNLVAQRLVIAPHREGGQAQFVTRPIQPAQPYTSSGLAALLDWLRANLRAPHSISSMAKQAHLSPRTLQRKFQEMTGFGATEWLISERVAFAKELLEAAETPLAQVAEAAGFGSDESLRRHFRRLVQCSPSAYRKRFFN